MTISKMRWANDQASFQTATRLNNARVRGQATAISIMAQATLISGELIDAVERRSIPDDVRRILGSAATELQMKN
jgi:hypothetical protein